MFFALNFNLAKANINEKQSKQTELSFTEKLLSNTSGVNNKKHSFVEGLLDFKISDTDVSIRPYFGFGYAFNVGNYLDGRHTDPSVSATSSSLQYYNVLYSSTSTNNALPTMFNQLGGIVGFTINDKFMFEVSGYGGLISTSSTSWTERFPFYSTSGGDFFSVNSSVTMNTVRATLGYVLDKEVFGKYGDKNKLILLAGIAIGIYENTISDRRYASVLMNGPILAGSDKTTTSDTTTTMVSPEIGLAYQRYIVDHLSLRFDARMNGLGAAGNMAINGTFMASIFFHI